MDRLTSLAPGQCADLQDLGTDPVLAQRLLALGIMPGQQVMIEHKNPLKGPVLFRYSLGKVGLREKDAAQLGVQKNP
ncbi:MAG: ferrous iron transport protein A [Blastochloris sp.]|nr:ferrous iron transport protein A [Blastochloris sp.]